MNSVGIYVDGERLLAARLKRVKGSAEICALTEGIKPEGECTLVSGLDGKELILRKLSFVLKNRRAILKALPFQAESHLPYTPEESVLLPLFSKKAGGTYDVILSATTRTDLRKHLEKWQGHQLDPDQVSSIPNALFRFARHFHPQESDLLVLHLGEKESICGLILEGTLQHFYCFSWGRSLFEESPLVAENRLQKEVDRAISSLQKKCDLFPQKLLLTGDASLVASLKPKIETFSKLMVLEAPSQPASTFAIPLGLALEGLAQDQSKIQFRQGEFLSERAQKKRVKFASLYILSCITLALLTWLSTTLLLAREKSVLKESLVRIFPASMDASSSLEEMLESGEAALSKDKAPFPLHPTAPKVSDLLAWLSTHPKLTQEIDLKEVRYEL
ncbi:MAG: hypothetical protein ACHQT8_02890, partial [Chlamydiales bacterium]